MSEIFAAKYAIPHMLEQGSGYLLNTASAAGLLVIFDTVAYTVTKHAAIGFTEWLAATYEDQGIGVSVLCPAAVHTPILAGKEDTPEGQDAITTEQLADIVIEGLAEEHFMIYTHPWVLEKFAVKGARLRRVHPHAARRPSRGAPWRAAVSHAPRRHHRLRVRRPVRRQGAATRAGRGGGGGSHQPPPLPAAALPGRDRGALRGRHRAADPRRPATPAQRERRARRGRRHRRRRAASSRSTRWDARRSCPTTA